MTVVTIPVANYVSELYPTKCAPATDMDQQCKLWRFYCTCCDFNCNNYKLEDFLGKNLSQREKYKIWLTDWKQHYADVSELIRHYKRARSDKWFYDKNQEHYRKKLKARALKRWNDKSDMSDIDLLCYHDQYINENLDKLRRSAQHLLNARYTNKLASQALFLRNCKKQLTS